MNTFEVILCDEGHRLKNVYGTNTTLALGNCTAVRRLLLTGLWGGACVCVCVLGGGGGGVECVCIHVCMRMHICECARAEA